MSVERGPSCRTHLLPKGSGALVPSLGLLHSQCPQEAALGAGLPCQPESRLPKTGLHERQHGAMGGCWPGSPSCCVTSEEPFTLLALLPITGRRDGCPVAF